MRYFLAFILGSSSLLGACTTDADDASGAGSSGKADGYGEDERIEPLSLPTNHPVRRAAPSLLVRTRVDGTTCPADGGDCTVSQVPLTWREAVCEDERFAQQMVVAYPCTAFLVAPDIVATAGHCVLPEDPATWCEKYLFLLDRVVDANGALPPVKADDVVRCKRVIAAEKENEEDGNTGVAAPQRDYALIELERPITDRQVLRLAPGRPEPGTRGYVLGFPSGLPLKAAPAKVFETPSGKPWFVHDGDALPGNSGSPILGLDGTVIGMHVAGDMRAEYINDDTRECAVLNMSCTGIDRNDPDCRGNMAVETATFTP